jgi:hypothetical protein
MRLRLTNEFVAVDALGVQHTIEELTEVQDAMWASEEGMKFYRLADRSSAVNRISDTEFKIAMTGERLTIKQRL